MINLFIRKLFIAEKISIVIQKKNYKKIKPKQMKSE